MDTDTAASEIAGWTKTERVSAVLGLVLALGLLAICADVVSGGRLFRRAGCGCDDGQTADVS